MKAGLVLHEPIQPPKDRRRWIYITPDIAALMQGDSGKKAGFPAVEAELLCGRFTAGFYVSVSARSARCDIEQLENLDEAWVFCFRKPKPGWRLMGRFVARDVFVGMKVYDRHELAGLGYSKMAQQMIDDWAQVVPIDPLRGTCINDYIGHVVGNADEE